jgi:hypothetical protein
MNRFIFLFLSFFISVFSYSQRSYMVYIQSETAKPFFVKQDDVIHSSSQAGYIILSRLKDTVVHFSIGFPENKWPEQRFTLLMQSNDHGYLLKNFGEKGWGLFDLQSLSVIMNESSNNNSKMKLNEQSTSFTNLLSKASGDSLLLYTEIKPDVKKEEVIAKQETITTGKEIIEPVKKEATIVVNDLTTEKQSPVKVNVTDSVKNAQSQVKNEVKAEKQEVKTNPVEKPAIVAAQKTEPVKDLAIEKATDDYKLSKISRKSESSTTEGFGLVFIDTYADGKQDTIRLLIANDNKYKLVSANESQDVKPIKDTQTFLENAGTKPVAIAAEAKQARDCRDVAGNTDFLNLRKRMASEDTEAKMVEEAKRSFKFRCYSTEQIRNLSALFLTPLGKYDFFEAAYQHTSDADQFKNLESELKDEYYKVRFKEILDNK